MLALLLILTLLFRVVVSVEVIVVSVVVCDPQFGHVEHTANVHFVAQSSAAEVRHCGTHPKTTWPLSWDVVISVRRLDEVVVVVV